MKLIYVGDPMCSWCYGFGPELQTVVKHYKGTLDLEMVMGGLRPYNDEIISTMKTFLSHHWEDVSKASGQPFEYGILDRSDLTYDTEPPCRAQVIVRHLTPNKELAFFKACQKTFYVANQDMSQVSTYHPILKSLGISTADFDELFISQEYKNLVKQDFARASQLGVKSFPTLLLHDGTKTTILAQGYSKSTAIIQKVDQLIQS